MFWLPGPSLWKEWCDNMIFVSCVCLKVEVLKAGVQGNRKHSETWETHWCTTENWAKHWPGLKGEHVTGNPPPSTQAMLFFFPHLPIEQSCPVQLGSQLQSPVSGRKVPWPEHWSKHVALGDSQLVPPHPTEQWHSPLTQTPRPEHVGSMQSTVTWKKENTGKDHSKGEATLSKARYPVVERRGFPNPVRRT